MLLLLVLGDLTAASTVPLLLMYMLLALRVNLHRDKELLKSFDTIKNKSVCASQSKRGGGHWAAPL